MSALLTLVEARSVAPATFRVDVRATGLVAGQTACLRVVGGGKGWTRHVDAQGRARFQVDVVRHRTIPFLLLWLEDTTQVVSVDAELHGLPALRQGTVQRGVVWATGQHDIVDPLVVEGAHLVIGPGTTLKFAAGVGLVCRQGSSLHGLGTAERPVKLLPQSGRWAGIELGPSHLPSRLVHVRIERAEASRELERGGGLSLDGAELHADHLELADCHADAGGGLHLRDARLTVRALHCHYNQAASGAGLAAVDSEICLWGSSRFTSNKATADGGAIWTYRSQVELDHVSFVGNQAARGPAMYGFGAVVAARSATVAERDWNDAVARGDVVLRRTPEGARLRRMERRVVAVAATPAVPDPELSVTVSSPEKVVDDKLHVRVRIEAGPDVQGPVTVTHGGGTHRYAAQSVPHELDLYLDSEAALSPIEVAVEDSGVFRRVDTPALPPRMADRLPQDAPMRPTPPMHPPRPRPRRAYGRRRTYQPPEPDDEAASPRFTGPAGPPVGPSASAVDTDVGAPERVDAASVTTKIRVPGVHAEADAHDPAGFEDLAGATTVIEAPGPSLRRRWTDRLAGALRIVRKGLGLVPTAIGHVLRGTLSRRSWGVFGAGAGLAFGLTAGLGYAGAALYGAWLVDGVLAEHGRTLAVTLWARPSKRARSERIGFVYGTQAGTSTDNIYDRALPVDAVDLAPGGALSVWWAATKALEDSYHDYPVGLHPRLAADVFTAVPRLVTTGSLAGLGGASSISDQACGALAQNAGWYLDRSRVMRKLHDMPCGIGLRHRYWTRPDEIGVFYASHVPVMKWTNQLGLDMFARQQWGFAEGVHDERMTVGHQLALAAMSNKLYNPKQDNWADVKHRAATGLHRLVRSGLLDEDDVPAILAQIDGAKPKGDGGIRVQPAAMYRWGVSAARYEMQAQVRPDCVSWYGDFPRDRPKKLAPESCDRHAWSDEVRDVRLSILPEVQQALVEACDRALKRVRGAPRPSHRCIDAMGKAELWRRGEHLRCSGIVVDDSGRIVAAHAINGLRGFSDERRFERTLLGEFVQAGSLGKLFLAAQIPHPGTPITPDTPGRKIAEFRDRLRRSHPTIEDAAEKLDVSRQGVDALIRCYGRPRGEPEVGMALQHATKGDWDTRPDLFLRFLRASSTGEVLPKLSAVDAWRTYEGDWQERTVVPPEAPKDRPSWERCTALAWAQGQTQAWLPVPAEPGGTMAALDRLVQGGKTGTANPDDAAYPDGTNTAHVATVSWLGPDKDWYGGLFTLSGSHMCVNLGDKVYGGTHAGPIAEATLEALKAWSETK